MKVNGFDAIVFAGGRGSRLGGIDKASLLLDEKRMVDRVIEAARQGGAKHVIVVGPQHAGTLADFSVQEDPPFSGPLAALATGFEQVTAPWTMLLACDLVHPNSVVEQLVTAIKNQDPDSNEGVVLVDDEDQVQWLASCVHTDSLAESLADESLRVLENGPVRSVLADLRIRKFKASSETTADIDTPEQLAVAKDNIEKGRTMNSSSNEHPKILDEWVDQVSEEFGLDSKDVSIAVILKVAADVAHAVARPAAPLSTFFLGLALGKEGTEASLEEAAAKLSALAKRYESES